MSSDVIAASSASIAMAEGGYKRWTFSETMDFLRFDGLSPSVVSAVCIAQN